MGFVRKSPGAVTAYEPGVQWKARAWGLMAYLVVLAAVATIVLIAVRYQPLSAANLTAGPVTGADRKMVQVGYSEGDTFSFGFLLGNEGPLTLKIQSIQIVGRRGLLVPVRLETSPERYAGTLDEGDQVLERFLPFSLSGGDRRWIVVRTRFGDCARFRAGALETYTRFQVTYSVLGFTKHAWIALPKNIGVVSPPDAACPSRAT